MAKHYQRQPRCKLCKSDFFQNYLGVCIGCRPDLYVTPDSDFISIFDSVRYAEMDRMGDAANGDL